MRTAKPTAEKLDALLEAHGGDWVAVLSALWRPGKGGRRGRKDAERRAAQERAREREKRFARYAQEATLEDYKRVSELVEARTVA